MSKSQPLVLIKITKWESQEILGRLNQASVVDGTWFTRVAKLKGELYYFIYNLHTQGKLVMEVLEEYKQTTPDAVNKEAIQDITLTKAELIEIIRSSYTSGGDDYKEGNFYWCPEGSLERAEEILEELGCEQE